jgi:dUTP pyrophosphatase
VNPHERHIQVKRLHPDATLPTKAYNGDAGWDLYSVERVLVGAGQKADIPTGIAVAVPEGYVGVIVGRSSTWRKHQSMTILGVIDAGYRGELFACVRSDGRVGFQVDKGERVAQMLILPVPDMWCDWVDELPDSHRGEKGWGSSGN